MAVNEFGGEVGKKKVEQLLQWLSLWKLTATIDNYANVAMARQQKADQTQREKLGTAVRI